MSKKKREKRAEKNETDNISKKKDRVLFIR